VGGNINSSPAYSKGKIYFGCEDKKLYCYDTSGAFVWASNLLNMVSGQNAQVKDNYVYINDSWGHLYAFDANTGTQKWIKQVQNKANLNNSAFVVDENSVYLQARLALNKDSLLKLNRLTGAVETSMPTYYQEPCSIPPIIIQNNIYTISDDNVLCLDKSNLSVKWVRQMYPGWGSYTGGIAFMNNYKTDLLIADNHLSRLYCINALDGSIKYARSFSSSILYHGLPYIGTAIPANTSNAYPMVLNDNIVVLPMFGSNSTGHGRYSKGFKLATGENAFDDEILNDPVSCNYYNNHFYSGSRLPSVAPFTPWLIKGFLREAPFVFIVGVWSTRPGIAASFEKSMPTIITKRGKMVRFGKYVE
jgi:hypothetical protein